MFSALIYVHRSGTARSHGNSVVSFLRTCQTVFHSSPRSVLHPWRWGDKVVIRTQDQRTSRSACKWVTAARRRLRKEASEAWEKLLLLCLGLNLLRFHTERVIGQLWKSDDVVNVKVLWQSRKWHKHFSYLIGVSNYSMCVSMPALYKRCNVKRAAEGQSLTAEPEHLHRACWELEMQVSTWTMAGVQERTATRSLSSYLTDNMLIRS